MSIGEENAPEPRAEIDARGVTGSDGGGDATAADGRGGRPPPLAAAVEAATVRSSSCSREPPNGEAGRATGAGLFSAPKPISGWMLSLCSCCHVCCQSCSGGSGHCSASAAASDNFWEASVTARRSGACGGGAHGCGSMERREPSARARIGWDIGDAAVDMRLPSQCMGLLACERMLGDERDGVPCAIVSAITQDK